MKKILLTTALFLMGLSGFSQTVKENGTIYIEHPYINVVLQSTKDYVANNFSRISDYYSDTAKWWASGLEDFVPIADAIEMWKSDYKFFDNISMNQMGYPDFLHYVKGDVKVVQSWWIWKGKSKKSGKTVTIYLVQFDEFNKDGKIIMEYIYGDLAKMAAEEM